MKVKEMRAKREAARLSAVNIIETAEREDRFLTDEENTQLGTLEEEVRGWDNKIQMAERFNNPAADPEPSPQPTPPQGGPATPPVVEPPNDESRSFRSFGEQMMAVYRAAMPSGTVDERLNTRAASGLNETVPSDGGFLVQQDFVSELLKNTYETGILAGKVRRIPMSTNANGLKINALDETSRKNGSRWGGLQTYWESEASELTGSKPKFRQMDLNLKKLTGLCYATDELLQDAAALESVLREGFAEEFSFKIDDAILNGTGAGMPLGILKSEAAVKVAKEGSQTEKILPENIFAMFSRCHPRSKSNAEWFINAEIEPLLYGMKMGDIPVYVPAGGLAATPCATLMGRPVTTIEQASEAGEAGDIIFGDFSQYLMIDKGGINAASSIHVRFLYDENVFRFIYRVDGQPIWKKPITPFKGNHTTSPFVTLAKR